MALRDWLPWGQREQRASYTDAAISFLTQQLAGMVSRGKDAAPVQASASLLGRTMAMADVGPSAQLTGLTASVLYDLGRALVEDGEYAALIVVDSGRVTLARAHNIDPFDGPDGMPWYRLNIPTASSVRTVVQPAAGVFHPRINVAADQPYKGRGQTAPNALRMSAAIENSLANESQAPSGYLIPFPSEAVPSDDLTSLKEDLRKLAGRATLVPSMSQNLGLGRSGAPSDWQLSRMGANPPQTLYLLLQLMFNQMASVSGSVPALFSEGGEGAGRREALRQYLHTTLQPLGQIICEEAMLKLHPSCTMSFDRLFASDIQGRARSFKSMVEAGMDISKAAALSGLMEGE